MAQQRDGGGGGGGRIHCGYAQRGAYGDDEDVIRQVLWFAAVAGSGTPAKAVCRRTKTSEAPEALRMGRLEETGTRKRQCILTRAQLLCSENRPVPGKPGG